MGWRGGLAPQQHQERSLHAGELLFRQGDAVEALYFIMEGSIRLLRVLEDGTAVTLHVARAGESLAEASLFTAHYHCDALALENSRLLAVPKHTLKAALESDAQASLAFAHLLAKQVRDLRAHLELRNIKSAPQRVLAWLRLHAMGSPPCVELDRPWNVIATEIGLSHEAVYRALTMLQNTQRICRDKQRIILLK